MKIKSTLKRLMIVLCCALLCLSFAACGGTYVPPQTGGVVTPSNPSEPDDPSSPSDDPTQFVVTLRRLNSSSFNLNGYKLKAYWTDTSTSAVYSAQFDENGTARCSGLDGDYRVTLSTLPDGYTYDANGYTADNYDRETRVVLYQLSYGSGKGTGWYEEVCSLASTGIYRATLTKINYLEGVHYTFTPTVAGEYSIESMIDTTNNELNPILDVFNGSKHYIGSQIATQDDGGAENTYTKNFKWTIQIDSRHVGNSFLFCVRATALTENMFPINVDFKLERDGEFSSDRLTSVKMTPQHDFAAAEATAFDDATGTFKYIAKYDPSNKGYLDGSLVAYNQDDGYYHLCTKDEDGNVISWGKKIYAKITQDSEVVVTPSNVGFCHSEISLRFLNNAEQDSSYSEDTYFNYQEFIRNTDTGYAGHVNGDGVYPVTKELKIFLQRFSVSNRYFNDGNGYAEVTQLYSSSDSNQWLFSCGYYA